MANENRFYLTASELSDLMGISIGHAYKLIRDMNAELAKEGYIVVAGKVPKRYVEKRCYSCAVILIGHMNKNSGDKSSYRGLGSIDFQAAARSVLVVGRIKDDPTLRVVCPTKSSLAPEGKAVAFRLDPEQGFQWVGQYDISADELLSGSRRGHKMRAAQDFLKEILADGAVPQTEIETAAEKAGIKPKTLRNARYELGVVSSKVGRQWMWALPEE